MESHNYLLLFGTRVSVYYELHFTDLLVCVLMNLRPKFKKILNFVVAYTQYTHSLSLLALQPPLGVLFYSPLVGFSLLACEVS